MIIDTNIEKIIPQDTQQDNSTNNNTMSPTKHLIAIDNKANKMVECDNDAKQIQTTQSNNTRTYAESVQKEKRDSCNDQIIKNSEQKNCTFNNRIIDAQGYELIESKNNKKKRIEQLANLMVQQIM